MKKDDTRTTPQSCSNRRLLQTNFHVLSTDGFHKSRRCPSMECCPSLGFYGHLRSEIIAIVLIGLATWQSRRQLLVDASGPALL